MSNPERSAKMTALLCHRLRVVLSDGRSLVGDMLAFDKHMNIVLSKCEEFRRIKIKNAGPDSARREREEKRMLGLVVLRGDIIVSFTIEAPPPQKPSSAATSSSSSSSSSAIHGSAAARAMPLAGTGLARAAGRGAPLAPMPLRPPPHHHTLPPPPPFPHHHPHQHPHPHLQPHMPPHMQHGMMPPPPPLSHMPPPGFPPHGMPPAGLAGPARLGAPGAAMGMMPPPHPPPPHGMMPPPPPPPGWRPDRGPPPPPPHMHGMMPPPPPPPGFPGNPQVYRPPPPPPPPQQ